jgi:hypothetical protein
MITVEDLWAALNYQLAFIATCLRAGLMQKTHKNKYLYDNVDEQLSFTLPPVPTANQLEGYLT